MARARWLLAELCVGWFVLVVSGASGVVAHAQAQTAAATPGQTVAPARKTCTVNSFAPNPAETALNKGDFAPAEVLFRALLAKSADNEAAHEGLVRALLAQNKVDDAARDAETWAAAEPASSMALIALGDVRLRQGVPRVAFLQFQKAAVADLCNARAYYGIAEVDGLAGLHASSKRMIEQAYKLHPTDDDINSAWIDTLPRKERLAKWADYAEHSDQISEENRTKLKTNLEKESLYHASDCRMAPTSPREATVPMTAVMDGPNHFVGWGLDVKFNGKGRRLQIDTGASGITISRAAAMFLGIQRQDATQTGGIGDKAKVKTSITHVASVKIGGIEFTNCPVEILEKWSVLDSDGLIGGDVFDASLLTLDFPKHELRIAPLPERPGEKKAAVATPDPADDDEIVEAHDPYIAPGMEKWQRVYRYRHDLIMPTGLVDTKRIKDDSAWKDKLFILDTGADSNLISPAAAREVTKVSRDDSMEIRGIQGEVDKVYEAGKFTLAFAGLRLDSPSMTSIDTTKISHDDGVDISGFIGAPALTQLVLHIDYRDNLVWCEYTPKK
ncbi:MAG: aspartyl protease family protein [Acidobacteriaceae bacterium]